jgi:wobble nucleotide-excising tRNase
VRNTVSGAKLETHPTNPVKTSYDLLWAEVRRKDPSPATIQNTLRRILESYFKILGGAKDDEICAKFQGKDRQVCESLFSWMNAGSHHTLDDLYVSLDNVTVAAYLDVFKRVFEASGHEAHYNMMMGEAAWAA